MLYLNELMTFLLQSNVYESIQVYCYCAEFFFFKKITIVIISY